MEGPGLVRLAAALEAASLRKPHTVWDWASEVRGLPIHRQWLITPVDGSADPRPSSVKWSSPMVTTLGPREGTMARSRQWRVG